MFQESGMSVRFRNSEVRLVTNSGAHLGMAVIFVLLFMVTGCRRNADVPITGTVTLDNAPVENATVAFAPVDGGQLASGRTDSGGNFSIHVAPGNYRVSVTKIVGVEGGDEDAEMPAEGEPIPERTYVVPERYANPRTSGIEVEITTDMDPLTFELESD